LIHGIFDADTAGLATGWVQGDDVTNSPTMTIVEEVVTNISNSHAQRFQHTFGDGTQTHIRAAETAVGSFAQNDYITFSFWVKGTVTGITSIIVQIRERDSSSVNGTNHTGADFKSTISSTEWKRIEYTVQLTDADLSLAEVQIRVSQPGSGSIDLNIAGAQVEQAAFPSSFIPTTTAALTRNLEALTYPVPSNFVGGTDGSVAFVYHPIMLPDEQPSDFRRFWEVFIDSNNRWTFLYGQNSDDYTIFSPRSGGTAKSGVSSAEPYGSVRYSLHSLIGTYSTTADGGGKKVNLYLDGVSDGSNADYVVPEGSLPASFFVQTDSGHAGAMILTDVALFNKRLSAAEAAQVHTIMTR